MCIGEIRYHIMRGASGLSQTHISAIFNVHSATISRIVRREWRKEVA